MGDQARPTGWIAALAAGLSDGERLPHDRAVAFCTALCASLAADHAGGQLHGADLPPALRAPELLAGGRPSVAGDVYALGAGLYTLLAGVPPHHGPAERDVPADELLARRQFPPAVVPDVPHPVNALLRRTLAKNPDQRPADAEDLADALRECARMSEYSERRRWADQHRPLLVVQGRTADRAPAPTPAGGVPSDPDGPGGGRLLG